jgi:hypothetical protein
VLLAAGVSKPRPAERNLLTVDVSRPRPVERARRGGRRRAEAFDDVAFRLPPGGQAMLRWMLPMRTTMSMWPPRPVM